MLDATKLPAVAKPPEKINALASPISIYEVHLGSWRRGNDNSFLSYRDIAEQLPAYLKQLGFTHVELMPINEHPFDGSWGYQPTGLFAPTSRFGSPEDFVHLINAFHREGLGVILDWVPGHFPDDPHGLGQFDGTALYEHANPSQGRHLDWGTLIYNYGRTEVVNFLSANALFWMERYGIDGLRVDAVASMLYLDYSRPEGGWVPNKYGGRENLEAIEFLRRFNRDTYAAFPDSTTIAEESTAWPNVSRPIEFGGLGFGYKWNMGWMHDTLNYIAKDPIHRKHHHGQILFGLHYAFSENFVLPLSHDEVVHGKRSLLGRMPGDQWQRFANLRAYYGFMFGHPGKKLMFMGCEIAQEREWNHDQSLDWHLLDQEPHRGIQSLIGDLNALYRNVPALHELDADPAGFEWLITEDADNSVFAWLRKGNDGRARCVVIANFTPGVLHNYRVRVPFAGAWREILNTDSAHYGGSNHRQCGTSAHPRRSRTRARTDVGRHSPFCFWCRTKPDARVGRLARGDSAQAGTAAARTSLFFRQMPKKSSCACSKGMVAARSSGLPCLSARKTSGMAISARSRRGSSTVTASPDPMIRTRAHRFNANKLVLDPYARKTRGPVDVERCALRLSGRQSARGFVVRSPGQRPRHDEMRRVRRFALWRTA